MKYNRLFAVIATLSLALSMGLNASADGIDLSGVENSQKNLESSVSSDDLKSDEVEKGIFDLGSTDVVTCLNGEYTIDTDILDVTIYPPFGWVCFTQDLSQQLDLYTVVFTDPTSAVQSFIQDGIHAFLLDSSWNYNCNFSLYQDSLASLIGNSSELSIADETVVLNHIRENCFTDCTEATADTYGNNRFYKFVFSGGTAVLYETYINSVCVDFLVYSYDDSVIDDDICSDVEYMLADFTAS